MLSAIISTHESERSLVPTLSALVPAAATGLIADVVIADANSRDATACKKFYGAVFAWTALDQAFGPMTYTIFKKGDLQTAGMLQMTAEWGDMKSHWMPYISVDDCDAMAGKITENGGKVCVPPTDISVGRFAVVEDPGGAYFSIIKLKM